MFIQSLNLYRGLAIIMVVAGHTYGLAKLNFDTFIERFYASLVTGATTVFIFISGFLFHHIFYPRYNYLKFIKGKSLNILIPYIILTTPPIIFIILKNNHYYDFFKPAGAGFFEGYAIPFIKYVLTGRAVTAYWYVPFIFLTFLCAPLHVAFIRSGRRAQLILVLSCYLVSSFLHRPVANINTIHSVAYAFGPYFLGIWCSINKESIYRKLTGWEWVFFTGAIVIAAYQASQGLHSNFHKAAFEYQGIDWMLLQKALLSIFFLVFLHRYETLRIPPIELISKVSFAIFFIHPWFIWAVIAVEKRLPPMQESWALYFAITASIIAACTAIAWSLKLALGRNSRYLIGY